MHRACGRFGSVTEWRSDETFLEAVHPQCAATRQGILAGAAERCSVRTQKSSSLGLGISQIYEFRFDVNKLRFLRKRFKCRGLSNKTNSREAWGA